MDAGARPACAGDLPTLVELAFSEALDDPTTGLWAGTIDDIPVGYAVVSADGDVAVIEEVHVHPDARAVGVGEAMLDRIVVWAGEQGCSGIDSFALPGTRDTKNFFETFGMTARLLVVHRDL